MALSSVSVGPDLPEIYLEALGFSSVSKDRKLKLLPTPWPENALPPSSASLLSVASKRRLLAAAGPDVLVITSTDGVRKAYTSDPDDNDFITSFRPDITLPSPQLRHVSFSADDDFLVVSAEKDGGLVIYSTDDLDRRRSTIFDLSPGNISTDGVAVRALLPNPQLGHYYAAVLDSGRLVIADVEGKQVLTLRENGATCVGWSNKGKALVAGLEDGTAVQYHSNGTLMCTIPRPPEAQGNYTMTAISWLNQNEFLTIHSPLDDTSGEAIYHIIRTDKDRSEFTFHKSAYDFLFPSMDAPERTYPPRYSVNRLRNWKPDLDDLLILSASHSSDFGVMTNSSAPIASDQQVTGEFNFAALQDNRQPKVPQVVNQDNERDGLLIGDALDLSSRDIVMKPIPTDDEFRESVSPLPALLALNDQGIMSSWWIVFDKSIRSGTSYPGLTVNTDDAPATPAPVAPQPAQKNIFGGSGATSTTPSIFGVPSATTATPPASIFGKPSASTATPPASIFGKPSFQPQQNVSNNSGFNNKPTPGASPAFGAPSKIGFGGTQSLGNQSSPWGSAPQTTNSQTSNAFSGAAGNFSGFAKLGGANNSPGGSGFSSFSSVGGGKSPFSSLSQQKSAFGGNNQGPSSFGSTLTLTSREGSNLPPSWGATSPQQGGSVFGTTSSSFSSTKESNMGDDGDAERRKRDEATPTPQNPFGNRTEGFKLVSSFEQNEAVKEDANKSSASENFSFNSAFSSALGATTPLTPHKKEGSESKPYTLSTTPAVPPKSTTSLFQSTTPNPSFDQKPPSPPNKGEDAPLPPDFTTWKQPKSVDDDLPPIAGSPAIKVEAPESDVPSSPLDDGEDDLSIEEHDGDDEEEDEEEPSPSDAARRGRPSKGVWAFTDSVNQSPRIPPAAPTPPTLKSGPSSRSGDETRVPSQGPKWNQPHFPIKPTPNALFPRAEPPPPGTSLPQPSVLFPPPSSKLQENLRSPSPQRAVSTSALGRRQQQQPLQRSAVPEPIRPSPKPPTPQPEVSDLSDDEDERIKETLASEITPSRELSPFNPHSDYAGSVSKTGTAAQIEMLYRDINSMVDTLGLNSRSLASFIAYHSNQSPKQQSDLSRAIDEGEQGTWYEDWTLNETEELRTLEDQLEQELNSGRVQNVVDVLRQLNQIHSANAKLLTKLNDIRRQNIMRKDPEKAEAVRKAPLAKELAEQQKAIRTEYAKLLSLLGRTEEEAYLLKSKVASCNAASGKSAAVPTVDAVKKTINRLIQMTQNKNNDILLLEQQLRKLDTGVHRPTSSSSHVFGTPKRASRGLRNGQSPLATPPTNRSRMSLSELNRSVRTPEPDDTPSNGYGLYYTPEGSPSGGGSRSLIKLADLDEQNLEALKATAKKRSEVAETLAKMIRERGVKITKFA